MMKRIVISAAFICGVFAAAAMGNEVDLINKHSTTLLVTYKVAYKNNNGPVIFDAPQSVEITKSGVAIQFSMKNYARAGVVIESVAGHPLPQKVTDFDKPAKCSMTTDTHHAQGKIKLSYTQYPNHHGKIMCETEGGIFGK